MQISAHRTCEWRGTSSVFVQTTNFTVSPLLATVYSYGCVCVSDPVDPAATLSPTPRSTHRLPPPLPRRTTRPRPALSQTSPAL